MNSENRGYILVIVFLVVVLVGSWFYFFMQIPDAPMKPMPPMQNEDMKPVPGEDPDMMGEPQGDKTEPTATNPGGFSPNSMSTYIFSSDDGMKFTEKSVVSDMAAVPHIMQNGDGDLVATFQHFSNEDESENNVIAYSVSDDLANTWSDPEMIVFEDLPGSTSKKPSEKTPTMAAPVDPTLVQLEDGRYRLYFTFHQAGDEYPGPVSAIADSLDSEFVYEGKLFENDETYILDPAVVYYDGLWHYFTSSNGLNSEGPNLETYIAYHATSEDGKDFELQEKLELPFNMLGGAAAGENGIYFFGSGGAGFSKDGYQWDVYYANYMCSDPGAVMLSDGSFLMACQNPTN